MPATSELTWRRTDEGVAIDCHAACGRRPAFEIREIATVIEPDGPLPAIRINPFPAGPNAGRPGVYGHTLVRQIVELVEERPWLRPADPDGGDDFGAGLDEEE